MTAVFDRYPNGGGEMLLALALADHASDDGTKVYPSVSALASKTRQSVRTVQYQLRRMEEAGWLILVGHGNGGRSMSSEYRISPDWLKGADIAPFSSEPKEPDSDPQKGADSAPFNSEKGAIHDTKGCNPLHPQGTIIEPSITIREPRERLKAHRPPRPKLKLHQFKESSMPTTSLCLSCLWPP